jgi:hypothetical protein
LIFISQTIAQNGAWYPMESGDLPSLKNGCAMTIGDKDMIYILKGNDNEAFFGYSISTNSITQLPDVPYDVGIGGAIIKGNAPYLYAVVGGNSDAFYRYKTDVDQWEDDLDPAPAGFYRGAALCWAGGDTVYAFRGGYRNFFKYSISGQNWVNHNLPQELPIPLEGASMCWTGNNHNYIYAILGGGTQQFYRYNLSNTQWESCPNLNTSWSSGASLIWDNSSQIYAAIGGNRDTMFVYNIQSGNWTDTIITPENIGGDMEGAGLLAWDNRSCQKQLYLLRGSYTDDLYRYCLPLVFPLVEKPLFGETFDPVQFPPPGWQAKLEEGSNIFTHNWKRDVSFTYPNPPPPPYYNIAMASCNPDANTRKRARLITPKFYLGTRPALVKINFWMFNTQESEEDTLLIEYYKPGFSSPILFAKFPRYQSPSPGWNRKEAIFVETDTVLVSFHGIDNNDPPYWLHIDSILISLDTCQLYSNTSFATAANQSHLLTRRPETERLHSIYKTSLLHQSGLPYKGLLHYIYSDDYGENWSIPLLIDTIDNNASSQNYSVASIATGVFDGKEPWITYVKPTNQIAVAIQRQNGTWIKMTLTPNFDPQPEFYELSMAMGLTQGYGAPEQQPDLAYVVAYGYTNQDGIYFFAFDTTGNTFAERVLDVSEDGCETPSIAITPADLIHIAYTRWDPWSDERVYYITTLTETNNYLTRTWGVDNWSDPFRVSQYDANTEPASYPSVEAYGKSVFVSWRGRNENEENIGEIWRREGEINPGYIPNWYDPQNMSLSTDQESHYPVMSSSQVTAFNEDISSTNKEVYANFWDNYIVNISETDNNSYFPHIDAEATELQRPPYALPVNTIWTEQLDTLSNYAYQIIGYRYVYPVEEKLKYYTIETGDTVQSPLCLHRDGFIHYAQLPIDFGNQKAIYQLSYLNPCYHYKIKAVVYQRAGGRFRQNFTIDSMPLGSIEYDSNIAETIEIVIPKGSYQRDSRAVLEITKNRGQFVTLANPLIVYQYEIPESTSISGPQSSGLFTVITKPTLYQNYPNPFTSQTAIRYALPTQSKVSLTVYDISGKEVRNLIDENEEAGLYSILWNGKNNFGKSVSSGIYFLRLKTDNYQITNRAIIIR